MDVKLNYLTSFSILCWTRHSEHQIFLIFDFIKFAITILILVIFTFNQ